MPASLKDHLPREIRPAKPRPQVMHQRRVLMLEGCVQPSLSPNTNAAAARVLDRLGISVSPAREAGCCGAVDYHLNAQEAGLDRARRNIDAWWPAIEAGAEAIVQTASGCGAFVREYGHLLKDDPALRGQNRPCQQLAKDLVEVLRSAEAGKARRACRQAHGLSLPVHPAARTALKRGRRRAHPSGLPAHCGARCAPVLRLGRQLFDHPAGDFHQLRDSKLNALESGKPEVIASPPTSVARPTSMAPAAAGQALDRSGRGIDAVAMPLVRPPRQGGNEQPKYEDRESR